MQGLIDVFRDNWAWVAGVGLAVAALVKLLLSQRFALKTDTEKAHMEIVAQVKGINRRLDRLERWEAVTTERLEHIPTIDDFRRLENSVGALNAGVEKLNAKSESTQASLTNLGEQLQHLTSFLLEAKR